MVTLPLHRQDVRGSNPASIVMFQTYVCYIKVMLKYCVVYCITTQNKLITLKKQLVNRVISTESVYLVVQLCDVEVVKGVRVGP